MTILIASAAFVATAGIQDIEPRRPELASSGVAAMKTAFAAAYNLDYEEAITLGRRAVALEPGNSRLHRGLASIIWQHILFKRGAVSVDYYLGSISRSNKNLPKPDPVSAAEFKKEIERAIELATARLKENPKDLQAKFDAGSAYGLQASYAASVDGSMMSAFRIAERAYDTQDGVLKQDPSRVAAGVVVGTYRYIVSTQNLVTRLMLLAAGMGSGKEKGIALLEAATKDPEARVDASAALMLVYSREGRHAEVVRITRALGAEFPRNRLLQLEEGAAATRAGIASEADVVLTRGIEALKHDTRPRIPSEEATWFYKRGLARLNLNQQSAAAADLQHALSANPTDWTRGRIQLEMGKLADLAGHRQDAVTSYQTAIRLCHATSDPVCEKEANRHLKKAFSFSGR